MILKKIVLFLFFITLLVVVIFGLYFIAKWFFSLNPNVIAALITATIGLIGLIYSQINTKKREIFESHREKKIEVYDIFFDLIEKFQNKDTLDGTDLPENFKEDFNRLTRGLILWGSPNVIKAYLKFRVTAVDNVNSKDILYAVDEMYQAIRKDLGNSNLALIKGDLIRLNLKDPSELL